MRTAPWLLVLFCPVTATVLAQQAPIKPVATVQQLHDAMIKPASDAIFDVGRHAPENEKEWTAVKRASIILAESGNLLMLGSRAKHRSKWMMLSRQLVDEGSVAMSVADAKSPSALMETSDRIVIVCESCHARYRIQGSRMPIR
jgi:hypothetical protein